MNYLKVLLPRPFAKPFDYRPPEEGEPVLGSYVTVPFGQSTIKGVVWEITDMPEAPPEKIKQAIAVCDVPPMPEVMRQFIAWVAEYSFTPIGSVLAMSMSAPQALEPEPEKARALKHDFTVPERFAHIDLSEAQREAANVLVEHVKAHDYQTSVVDGVTGSGKTEVYLEGVIEALQEGGQVLVMLPEIVLTEQLMKRFEQRLGMAPVPWHSGLTPKQRRCFWRAVAEGEARLVVGARSALFLPYTDLRFIVVDEEHDASYKQEDGVAYHARDMAVVRASLEKIPIALVSATPSLETMTNIAHGKYQKLHLPERHGGAVLPEVSVIDMREEKPEADQFISATLREAMAETLAKGEQSLLFLNRRGYAPLTLCRKCGYRFQCPQCSSWLVEHKAISKLQCHHCGYYAKLPKQCPGCEAEDSLHACGPGVERLEEEVRAFLPEARVLNVSSDGLATPKQAREAIAKILAGEVDVIIGTQLIAKGHHFPKLTLVGIVDGDLGLEGGDLRSGEKTFQLLHQVSGRAGRAEHKGKVYIQTFVPEHHVMQALIDGDREAFLEQESAYRKAGGWPPYGRLVALIFSGKQEAEVRKTAGHFAGAAPRMDGVQVLGPAPAPLSLLRGQYRYRLLVKAPKQLKVQSYLKQWMAQVDVPRSVRVKVDVDPYGFM